MTNQIQNSKSEIRNRERLPVGLCVASICSSSLGLAAAAGGVTWGATPAPGDALREAWVYVHVMVTFGWLVAWPAMGRARDWRGLLWEFAAMAMGAVPATAVAAVLAAVTARGIAVGVVWQCSCGIFAMGILALAQRLRGAEMALPVLALAAPVAAYICSDMLPPLSGTWIGAVPGVAAARVALLSVDERALPLTPSLAYCAVGVVAWAAAAAFARGRSTRRAGESNGPRR